MDLIPSLDEARLVFNQQQLLWLFVLVALISIVQFVVRRQHFFVTLVRCLLLSTLVLALSNPVLEESIEKEHLSALVDVSGSIPTLALEEMAEKLASFTTADRSVEIIPFGAKPLDTPLTVEGRRSAGELLALLGSQEVVVARDGTDIGAALAHAATRSKGPVLLFSDGYSTHGDAQAVAKRFSSESRGVFPLLLDESLFTDSQLEIASLFAPVTAEAGEQVRIYSSIRNTLSEAREAEVEYWLDDKKLESKSLQVAAGTEQRVVLTTPALEGGLQRIRAVMKNVDGTTTTRHRWISVKERTKLLLLHGTKEDQDQLQELVRVKGYTAENIVTTGSATIPKDFTPYSAVIINNAARHQLGDDFLKGLERFAKQGGGVLLIGGDRSFGLGNYIDTPLEKISPLKFVPPQTQKKRVRVALALVLDKSGSMQQQQRMVAAKRAVVASIESLQDDDYVTVVAFDDAPFVILNISTIAQAKKDVDRRLRNLTARGQTNLLPAMAQARQLLARAEAGRKHMIVLSDGQFPLSTNVYVNEINELKRQGVSISAVALGSEADLPFMKFLAKTGGGSFHHTLDSSRLPNIFIEDIKVATGEESMAERDLFPVGKGPGGIRSTSVSRFPPLKGFVETLPKKGSRLELITRRRKGVFPILASWEYGKGHVAAFTSDANGRWSQPWLRWPQFFTFWTDILDWIRAGETGQAGDIDFDVRYSIVQGNLSFELLVYDESLRSSAPPSIQASLIEPSNEKSTPSFSAAAPGRFEASIPGAKPGDYRLRVRYGEVDLPPVGITLHDDSFGEQAGRGIDQPSLLQLATASGGRIISESNALEFPKSIEEETTELYPALLLLAFCLILFEAILRERVLLKE